MLLLLINLVLHHFVLLVIVNQHKMYQEDSQLQSAL